MPRGARLDAPGTLHHIIIRGIEKRRIVDDKRDMESFVIRLGDVLFESETAVYAWALMTNHAHILLRSGPKGISQAMRRFMTGYAISYNLRHHRHGHLFQNRYKSIICDENEYFAELVRYIHLNPLRAGIVNTLSELDHYRYCGHRVIMGKKGLEWQDRVYVLKWFGSTERNAKKTYREFIQGGIDQGKRPDLVGGGLIRSLGGWSDVISMRRRGERKLTDERILGSGAFVQKVLDEAEETTRNKFSGGNQEKQIDDLIKKVCQEQGVNIKELRAGSRRTAVSRTRVSIATELVREYGVSLAEVARNMGVTSSGIFRILKRNES
jgi:REP-associated tyrosine transposase